MRQQAEPGALVGGVAKLGHEAQSLQMEYDLAQAEKDARKIKVQRITGRRIATG